MCLLTPFNAPIHIKQGQLLACINCQSNQRRMICGLLAKECDWEYFMRVYNTSIFIQSLLEVEPYIEDIGSI